MLYSCKGWAIEENVQRRKNVSEMKCLRATFGVRQFDWASNKNVREICSNKKCS